MNEISDFNKYKKAKIVVKELETVIQILKLAKVGLKPFRKYSSLSETLLCIGDSLAILEIHHEHHKRILETKGIVDEKA